jgi:hypothetical protein
MKTNSLEYKVYSAIQSAVRGADLSEVSGAEYIFDRVISILDVAQHNNRKLSTDIEDQEFYDWLLSMSIRDNNFSSYKFSLNQYTFCFNAIGNQLQVNYLGETLSP